MEQKNKQQTETNKSPKIDPEEKAILNKFEEELTKQARDLQGRLSDMSAEKLASVFFNLFVYFMIEGRTTILSESNDRFPLVVWDVLLLKIFRQGEEKIKDESEILHRALVRIDELEKTLQSDQIDKESILDEEKEKYYAEKKVNEPEAD